MSTCKRPRLGAVAALAAASLTLLSACASVTPTTKERVAQTQTAVQQAQSTIGNSESGAVELQRAREHLAAAQRAVEAGKEGDALRAANEAQLSAELAVAKSQSASARKAADDMLAAIQTLRNETERQSPVTR